MRLQDLAQKFKLGQFQLVYMSIERLFSLYIHLKSSLDPMGSVEYAIEQYPSSWRMQMA